jgi:hypothetical protein
MHILTGMLLAGVLGRKRAGSVLPMVRTGPVRTVHLLPGRVRFRVPSLVGARPEAEALCDRLRTIDGVKHVEADPTSGSLLVRYRKKIVRAELLFAATVRLLGLEKQLDATPRPVVVRELREVFRNLNRAVYDCTGGILDFSSAVLILLAAAGATRLARQGTAAMPAGFTLLWWGVRQLLGQGDGHGNDVE